MAGVAIYHLARLPATSASWRTSCTSPKRYQVSILAGNLPNTRHHSVVGRFDVHMLVSAAQFQRDLDSKRMKAMMARTFMMAAPWAASLRLSKCM